MKRRLATLAAVLITLTAAVFTVVNPAWAATGLRISGRNIVEANGSTFVMRGINHMHTWYAGQTQSFADMKAAGANTVRVVLSGGRWTANTAADVTNVINLCKANKLICVLEDHDTTGYGEDGAAYTLDQAVNYWIGLKSVLVGQENYVVINIGNEPIGNTNPAQWTAATVAAIQKMRTNGFEHLLMVDAPNWGQDWQYTMRDNAQTVLNADTRANTVLSIHMYAVFNTAASIRNYLDVFQNNNWPLVIGEFGWQFASGEVDDTTLMAEAQARGLGYLGWSWAGNTDPILDMTNNFNAASLTTWGQRIVNGPNGLKATSKEATIFGGVQPSSPTPSSPSPSSPSPSPSSPSPSPSNPQTGACSATYAITGSWQGGFQGDVKVTAGTAPITAWTVTWTFANGQTVNNAWGATVTTAGSTVTARNAAWNGTLSAGASTNFGFLGSWAGTNTPPTLSCTAS